MLVKLIGLVLPLGLDTFAVAAALGISGLRPGDRLRVSALFTAFEMGMPLVGFFGGGLFGRVIGSLADAVAIAILLTLGAILAWPRAKEREEERIGLLARTRGLAALGLGISISLDELAIGFTVGLLRFPVVLVIVLIGTQTLIVTQAGLRLGSSVGDSIRERAEQLAGAALGTLGIVLLVEKLMR